MSETKERPILFSDLMVRAILEGRKVQTRRVIKPQPTLPSVWATNNAADGICFWTDNPQQGEKGRTEFRKSKYGQPGDRLWVRENGWQRPERSNKAMRDGADTWPRYEYDANDPDSAILREWKWIRRPSIHMPRWAARIMLEITGVRVERVREISDADAGAEGGFNLCGFSVLWDDINAKRGYSWESNPWVWVLSFKVITPANNPMQPTRQLRRAVDGERYAALL